MYSLPYKKKDPDRGRKPERISVAYRAAHIKRKTPIGDGNLFILFSLSMVQKYIKRKTPIGDGNGPVWT